MYKASSVNKAKYIERRQINDNNFMYIKLDKRFKDSNSYSKG